MQYYRCKCGNAWAFGSMPPRQCAQCSECKSDFAQHPYDHREPKPHDFSEIETIQTDQGTMTITRCRYCYRTRGQIAAAQVLKDAAVSSEDKRRPMTI